MKSGIYGDITGKPFEVAHFHIWKLSPKNGTPKISLEVKKKLLEATKQANVDILYAAWKEYAPEHYDGLITRINESGYAFTDDTVMHIATMDAYNKSQTDLNILPDFKKSYLEWGQKYLHVGYGGMFRKWLEGEIEAPFNSFGNGSAMRAGSIAWTSDSVMWGGVCSEHARGSAIVTHNNPEGIRGAEAVVYTSWLGLRPVDVKISKEKLKEKIERLYYYDLGRTVEEIRQNYLFEVSCQKSVPEAIICFLESTDVESAIANAISLGGDADTQAMIAGCIAEAYYREVPKKIIDTVDNALPDEMLRVIETFEKKFNVRYNVI